MYVRCHKNKKNYGNTLLQAGRRLKGYVFDRQYIFATKTSNVSQKAEEYIKSLWISRLTNIERMNETGIPEKELLPILRTTTGIFLVDFFYTYDDG